MNDSQPQLDYLREYAPDVVAALTNLGQSSGYYDANGHYARTQPVFNAFTVNGFNQLDAAAAVAPLQGPAGRPRPLPRRRRPADRPTAPRRGRSPAAIRDSTPPGP